MVYNMGKAVKELRDCIHIVLVCRVSFRKLFMRG